MTRIPRSATLLLLPVLLVVACSAEPANDFQEFEEALHGGADCAELIDMVESWDPDARIVEPARDRLRQVGCDSRESVRNDR